MAITKATVSGGRKKKPGAGTETKKEREAHKRVKHVKPKGSK
jgi:hypothetical protein